MSCDCVCRVNLKSVMVRTFRRSSSWAVRNFLMAHESVTAAYYFREALSYLQVTSVAESGTGPNTAIQGFVGLLGVLAVPVVGYSLYTLYKTGARRMCTCNTPSHDSSMLCDVCRVIAVMHVRCCSGEAMR